MGEFVKVTEATAVAEGKLAAFDVDGARTDEAVIAIGRQG